MTGEDSATGLSAEDALEQVCEQFRSHDRFLLTSHENPDGDALGSLLAMHQILGQLGKDSVMFMAAKEFPLPIEYRFLPLQEVFHEPPADLVDRTLVFLDCGNIDRMPEDFLQRDGATVLNIDHHHDNTRFGTVDLVDVNASCTAEIVWEISKRLGATLTPEIAGALYVALVTDTGRFSYQNTDVRAHHMAADLIEAGVNVDETNRRLYERVPREKLRLLSRALDGIETYEDGALAIAYISADDYKTTEASEEMTEGIIDHVRSIEGTAVAAVIRDQIAGGRAARKVSLRSTNGSIDVSEIARAKGGGGHRRAAGFSTDESYGELVKFLSGEVAAQR